MDPLRNIGVSIHASLDEIKASYRRLIKIYHPDKNANAEASEFTKRINEVYDILSDPEKKRNMTIDLRKFSLNTRRKKIP